MKKYLFLMFALLGILSACEDEAKNTDKIFVEDDDLVLAIQNADNKVIIEKKELHYEAKVTLDKEYPESLFEEAVLAPELGYEVVLTEKSGIKPEDRETNRAEDKLLIYFDLKGKKLGHRKGNRHFACFSFVFPITYIMPDQSEISGMNMKEIEKSIKAWYKENPDYKRRPSLIFPVEVNFRGKVLSLENENQLKRIRMACAGDKDDDKGDDKEDKACFEMVYPLTYILGDQRITRDSKKEMEQAIERWRRAHPDSKQRPVLQFPIEIKYVTDRGERIVEIENMEALKKAYEDCDK